ncbi:PREDICTED: protein FAM134C-like isoform X1 [Thamnophis sirtalis]|uniref:Protein FAM134C isoform X1 n=1 Tax=Thamnophis sirtalis TaxID=35019 RepID=A0A6I9YXA2_9SAUR|nr:PREDICTED: protein FAM134C isoform X1 [Thamnophis sirtalis]XP_013928256.1 PREDICTED: protein FAM134C-like isoform X1 [Thamnophis sirtalis]
MLGEGRMAAAEAAGRAAGSSSGTNHGGGRGLVTDAQGPSSEREQRVRALSAFLRTHLGPYEPILTALQATLTWEKPARSALGWVAAHAAFGFFALTSLHLIFVIAFTLILIVCLDQWKNRIWPEIKAVRPDQLDNESWGFVHPRLLSVPELCHFLAKGWITGDSFMKSLLSFKEQNPGKFCLLACGALTFLTVLGYYIPGVCLAYLIMLSFLLWPLAVYHNLNQHLYTKLQPALQRLDFSVRGYMMSKHKERQSRHHIWREHPAGADESDSEEELAAFCPKLDDAVVAKELTISDSEHSDAEVSYTENGTFNLSRGQTPLTEGSEDFDGHSDPEESFARDLPDFPSINPEVTGIDDEDDTSIGIPSLSLRNQAQEQNQQSHKQEEVTSEFLLSELPLMHNLTDDLAGFVTRGMIQLALSGTSQSVAAHSNRQQRSAKAFLRTSSSELDTDAEGDDFELLDQSELNQMDPSNSRGQ